MKNTAVRDWAIATVTVQVLAIVVVVNYLPNLLHISLIGAIFGG